MKQITKNLFGNKSNWRGENTELVAFVDFF